MLLDIPKQSRLRVLSLRLMRISSPVIGVRSPPSRCRNFGSSLFYLTLLLFFSLKYRQISKDPVEIATSDSMFPLLLLEKQEERRVLPTRCFSFSFPSSLPHCVFPHPSLRECNLSSTSTLVCQRNEACDSSSSDPESSVLLPLLATLLGVSPKSDG